jgi:hypothetical protein
MGVGKGIELEEKPEKNVQRLPEKNRKKKRDFRFFANEDNYQQIPTNKNKY